MLGGPASVPKEAPTLEPTLPTPLIFAPPGMPLTSYSNFATAGARAHGNLGTVPDDHDVIIFR